jgi:hypothetical protein
MGRLPFQTESYIAFLVATHYLKILHDEERCYVIDGFLHFSDLQTETLNLETGQLSAYIQKLIKKNEMPGWWYDLRLKPIHSSDKN